MRKQFYCILYDDDLKAFDIEGPVVDDTIFTNSVNEVISKGINIRCSTPDYEKYKSKDELCKDINLPGYKYYQGLFAKHGISIS